MNRYFTHTCGELRAAHAGQTVRLAGWVHRKRDHGGILFVNLRDHFGLTQVVIRQDAPFYAQAQDVSPESVVQFTGRVDARPADAANPKMATGEVEVIATAMEVLSAAAALPFPVADETAVPEALRLKFRFLDLRREHLHQNIILRSRVIASMRRRMWDLGFHEFNTPILTVSSPEGARDYLVPSRVHPGKFYALPQAPQQFKQLLMVAGFHRYFQIAPCFRDEDARADRSPGDFYQLDLEMSFVEQADIFTVVEQLMYGLFTEFSTWEATKPPFPRIQYRDAVRRYGSDKPDLRIPLEIHDATDLFRTSPFRVFRGAVEAGGVVRALPVKDVADRPRGFFDELDRFVKEQGGAGLAYAAFPKDGPVKGPVSKHLDAAAQATLQGLPGAGPGSAVFLLAGPEKQVSTLAGRLRLKLGQTLDLVEKNVYRFCWIVDFPMYERNEETGQIEFCHNPFSMPQGEMEALTGKDPLDILAYQYDVVANGVELSSGAIRNHRPDIMYKAFEIAGYGREDVETKFGGMLRAFQYGAPPHGGIAPGVDRIVMMLANEQTLREVIAFPLTPSAEDLLMGAPSNVSPKQLRELHIKLDLPPEKKE